MLVMRAMLVMPVTRAMLAMTVMRAMLATPATQATLPQHYQTFYPQPYPPPQAQKRPKNGATRILRS